MVHGPGIGTGGVVRPLEWVIFLRGCICIYILTTRLNSTPSPPVSRATCYTRAPRCNARASGCAIVRFDFGFAFVCELVISFGKKGCIRTAIVRTVIRQGLSLSSRLVDGI